MIPEIAPIPLGVDRPLWSVMIPTYNCSMDYLCQAIESVLSQDLGSSKMQVEIVDNCSDNIHLGEFVKTHWRERVKFHRNSANNGIMSNFNACIKRSIGEFIHILHCDDLVEGDFYEIMEAEFKSSPRCAAIFSRVFIIDESGHKQSCSPFYHPMGTILKDPQGLMQNSPLYCPGAVVRRSFYERNGGFDTALAHVGDWDMWVRVVARGGAKMIDKPLASYRVHKGSETQKLIRSAMALRDHLRLGEKWRIEGWQNFDGCAFKRRVGRAALVQAQMSRVCGDHAAATANYELGRSVLRGRRFWWENIRAFVMLAVEFVVRRIKRWCYSKRLFY